MTGQCSGQIPKSVKVSAAAMAGMAEEAAGRLDGDQRGGGLAEEESSSGVDCETERAAGRLGGDQDGLGLACGGRNQDGRRREEARRPLRDGD
ncbi:MAG: hypothetical protein ACLP9L_26420 [Thermoguttaceae bacterium]